MSDIWWIVQDNLPVKPINGSFRLGDFFYPSDWISKTTDSEKHAVSIYKQRNVEDHPPQPYQATEVFTFNAIESTVDRTYNKTLPDIDTIKTWKKAKLASHRYTIETSGILINGSRIRTDRESQALINGAFAMSTINPSITIKWKAENGWVDLNASAITTIASLVGTHVQTCFSVEADHVINIGRLTTIPEVLAYDITTGWPSNV